MRFDAIGLFWEDKPKVKEVKIKEKPTPPDPVWLSPDYLPHYEDAVNYHPPMMSDSELLAAQKAGDVLIFDTESYPNYWSCGFLSVNTGKYLLFECDDDLIDFDRKKFRWVMENFTVVGYYSANYDVYTCAMAATGSRAGAMYWATQQMIEFGVPGWQVLKNSKHKRLKLDHIDLIELTALAPGLKMMAGRLDSPLMMDLPFKPGTMLSTEQIAITRYYMMHADLRNTRRVWDAHAEAISLRKNFGERYGLDLRSCSNAQMTEAIFRHEYQKRTGRPFRGGGYKTYEVRRFKYQMPRYIEFKTPNLQWLYETLLNEWFTVGETGYVKGPECHDKIKIPIGGNEYSFGVGGLHSNEKGMSHFTTLGGVKKYLLRDHDVTSYYPELILKSGLEPPMLRGMFRPIFSQILEERKKAKATAPKGVIDLGLKIVINGGFGKTSDPTSILYYPELMVQTTITGQLCLLMAIEQLTLAGFEVINANTDGIVVKCPTEREPEMVAAFEKWEEQVGLKMETTEYDMYFARDVNNYFAFKPGGSPKAKGVFSMRGPASEYKKNPTQEICSKAVIDYIVKGIPIEKTIFECDDIAEFVSVRRVKGSAAFVAGDYVEFAGKITRWYHAKDCPGKIVTADKGYTVPTTEGCRPILKMEAMPPDIDKDYYVQEAYKYLEQIGYTEVFPTGQNDR